MLLTYAIGLLLLAHGPGEWFERPFVAFHCLTLSPEATLVLTHTHY